MNMTESTLHPDLAGILDALFTVAQQLLSEHGEFYPFGAVVLQTGEIQHVSARMEGENDPQSLIGSLTETFQNAARRGNLLAAGICCDVLVIPPGKNHKQEAICCGLEHCLGDSAQVFVPYVMTKERNVEYGETFAGKRTPEFFSETPSC